MKNNLFGFSRLVVCSSLLLACTHSTPPGIKATPQVHEDLSQYKTADDLWNHTGNLLDPLDVDPAKADAAALKKAQESLILAQASAQAFVDTYPKDDRRWKAHGLILKLEETRSTYGLEEIPQDVKEQQLKELAQAPDAPPEFRAAMSSELISQSVGKAVSGDPAAQAELDQKIDAFEKEFGDKLSLEQGRPPETALLRLGELQAFLETDSDAQVQALMKKITAMGIPELTQIAQKFVTDHQAMIVLQEKTMMLKFTAVDGRTVDLSQMRGKVILVNFWATWCAPCVQEMPEFISLYQKYHGQGLEIIGVSLDQDKAAMLDFTQKNGMAWPEYFDGLGWQSPLAQQFHVQQIPNTWLIDKTGKLINLQAGTNLESTISKLLAP